MSELDGLKLLRLIEEGVAGKTGEALEGTPCEFVYKGQITAYARNVGDVFPVDRDWFEQMGVQSYLGIPVKDETGAVSLSTNLCSVPASHVR
jgi:hypothetical protein